MTQDNVTMPGNRTGQQGAVSLQTLVLAPWHPSGGIFTKGAKALRKASVARLT